MKKLFVVASMAIMLNTNVYANINSITVNADKGTVIRAGYMPTVEVVDTMDIDKDGSTIDTIKMNAREQSNKTAKFSILEYNPGDINVEKPITISVPEGITITGIKIENGKVLYDGKGYAEAQKAYGLSQNEFELESSSFFERVVKFDGNSVTLKDGESVDNEKLIDMRVTLFVTAPYDYSGDITVTVSGEGLGGVTDSESIGKITQVVNVNTSSTTANKGAAISKDIVVSEVVGGAFAMGEVVEFRLNNGATFVEMPNVSVKGGTLTGNTKLSSDKTTVKVTLDGKGTGTDKGTITLSNVKVNTNDVEVDNFVDIIISSNSTISNPINLNYVFVEKAETTDVKEDVGEDIKEDIKEEVKEDNTSTKNTVSNKFNKNVVFTFDKKSVSIDGQTKEISYAPYVSKKSGSTMIPLRALAEALGIPREHILWYQPTKTATIIVDDNTVAQFSIGSNVCYINANSVPMTSASGAVDVTEYQDGAVFLPMRFLSEAVFKVPVSWDKAKPKEVVFN